jgi:quinol-cytochrome oxidoreductase complex cytochrome b subunit
LALHNAVLLVAVLLGAGVLLGFVVPRWWVLAAPVVFGVYIALVTEVDEVPPWFLGAGYAVIAAVGVVVGLLLRQRRDTTLS